MVESQTEYSMSRHLDDVLRVRSRGEPKEGTRGRQTEWLGFCNLTLSSRMLIVDAQFVPNESDGLLVDLAPGLYAIEAKVMEYAGWWSRDRRISRMRVIRRENTATLGPALGATWADTGATAVCDYDVLSRWSKSVEAACNIVDAVMENAGPYGTAVYDEPRGAVVPYVQSGFGDGLFPVYELLHQGERVGVEVEFIKPDEPYPF